VERVEILISDAKLKRVGTRPTFQGDSDFNCRIVDGLPRREPSIDFLEARSLNTYRLPDPAILLMAARAGRILVSHDRQTIPAHFDWFIADKRSPGLIVVSQDLGIGEAVEELLMIWACSAAEEWINVRRFVPLSGGG